VRIRTNLTTWLLLSLSAAPVIAHDVLPWPAEPRNEAERLFNIGVDSLSG